MFLQGNCMNWVDVNFCKNVIASIKCPSPCFLHEPETLAACNICVELGWTVIKMIPLLSQYLRKSKFMWLIYVSIQESFSVCIVFCLDGCLSWFSFYKLGTWPTLQYRSGHPELCPRSFLRLAILDSFNLF